MTFPITIRQEDGTQASLECRELVGPALVERFRNNFVAFSGRARAWADVNMTTTSALLGGVRCQISYDPTDPHFQIKRAQLKKALEQFQGNHGFGFPNQRLEVYCVQSIASIGWVFHRSGRLEKTACVVLGGSVCSRSHLVADSVYDYYKPKIAAYAQIMRVRTAIFHEFGHIFHQLHNGNHYFAMGDLVRIKGKAQSELDDVSETVIQEARRMFPRRPPVLNIDTFSKAIVAQARPVSPYATMNPLEFVAEGFSALLMGVPLQELTLDNYYQIGGPEPPRNMCQAQLPSFFQTVERTRRTIRVREEREREERNRERRRRRKRRH